MSNRTSAVRRITAWNHIRAIALLPVMNVIVIPGTLLLVTSAYDLSWSARGSVTRILVGALALITLAAGITLVARAVRMFVRQGAGTLAPWDPTQRLLVDDIYRYCRNPMKAGLFLILFGEAVVLRSSVLGAWAALFAIVNVVYIRLSEEPGLRARFGAEYDRYCAQVPRWWPKLRGRSAPAQRGVQS